jgi:adenylyltransferase/sulfurtransferase
MTPNENHDDADTNHDASEPLADHLRRYVRQISFPPIGIAGQQRLIDARVLICGCGALGSVIANTLVRAGVGHVRLVDRDFLELNNLQRQVLFDEQDVEAGLPKAIAAANRLKAINSQVEIEPIVADVDHKNIRALCDSVDMILDGTDNFETRFLLNDASIKFNIPWVYGGCLGASGQTMTIIPGQSACLQCLMIDGPPPPGTTPTCDTAGIISPIINVIASLEANEAIKILSGNSDQASRHLNVFELWDNRFRQIDLSNLRASVDCPACQRKEFPWLEGKRGSHTAVLCGRNSVQLTFPEQVSWSLDEMGKKLSQVGVVKQNRFMLRCELERHVLTLFPDGRAIISGTEEIAEAKTLYAKYVGN